MAKIEKIIKKLQETKMLFIDDNMAMLTSEIIDNINNAIQTIRELQSNQCHLNSPCEYQNKDIDVEDMCEWIKYDYRTMCPREHDIDNPYWRIPKDRMDALKYCPYCGRKVKVVK